jgi:hypothetical protein
MEQRVHDGRSATIARACARSATRRRWKRSWTRRSPQARSKWSSTGRGRPA